MSLYASFSIKCFFYFEEYIESGGKGKLEEGGQKVKTSCYK